MNKNLDLMLSHSKQELLQADSKLGWLSAIYVLIITCLISLGVGLGHWLIIGLVLILPIFSLLVIFSGLLPEHVRPQSNEVQPLNPYEYTSARKLTEVASAELKILELIAINEKLARKKVLMRLHIRLLHVSDPFYNQKNNK